MNPTQCNNVNPYILLYLICSFEDVIATTHSKIRPFCVSTHVNLLFFFINILIPRSNFIMMNIGHAGLGAGFFAVCVASPVDVVRCPQALS